MFYLIETDTQFKVLQNKIAKSCYIDYIYGNDNTHPVLAKILTLASLQGIADLLTGEGIRFNDFEMDYKSSKNLTEIEELYAIGPAISILMSGYIEKDTLISLRGTLVPATTINKTIAKIPLIGELLVGKKTGEGVFGISFKIKGPPKHS